MMEHEELNKEELVFAVQEMDTPEAQERLWQEKTGLDEQTLPAAIEAVVFMSDKPIPLARIQKLVGEDVPLRKLHESLSLLQEQYEQKKHGIRLQEVAEGYQFRTKPTYSKFLREMFNATNLHLTPSMLEVLAIIAYKQPISKSELEKMRGVDSSHLIRSLLDKKLVKMLGRSEEELGRPTVYGTSQEFLDVFNLKDTYDLPPEHELQDLVAEIESKEIPDIKEIVGRGLKGQFQFNEDSEIDELKQTIKSIAAETEFTKSLKEEDKKKKNKEVASKSAFDVLEEFVQNDQKVSDDFHDSL